MPMENTQNFPANIGTLIALDYYVRRVHLEPDVDADELVPRLLNEADSLGLYVEEEEEEEEETF